MHDCRLWLAIVSIRIVKHTADITYSHTRRSDHSSVLAVLVALLLQVVAVRDVGAGLSKAVVEDLLALLVAGLACDVVGGVSSWGSQSERQGRDEESEELHFVGMCWFVGWLLLSVKMFEMVEEGCVCLLFVKKEEEVGAKKFFYRGPGAEGTAWKRPTVTRQRRGHHRAQAMFRHVLSVPVSHRGYPAEDVNHT